MTRPDSIKVVGLKTHLDNNAQQHKGKTYADLLEMLENRASNNYIARSFGVNKNTVGKWLSIHRIEQQENEAKSIR